MLFPEKAQFFCSTSSKEQKVLGVNVHHGVIAKSNTTMVVSTLSWPSATWRLAFTASSMLN